MHKHSTGKQNDARASEMRWLGLLDPHVDAPKSQGSDLVEAAKLAHIDQQWL